MLLNALQAGDGAGEALLECLVVRFCDVEGSQLRRGDVGASDDGGGASVEGREETSLSEGPGDCYGVENRVLQGQVFEDDLRHPQGLCSSDGCRGLVCRDERFEHRRRHVTGTRQDLWERYLRHRNGLYEGGGREDGPGYLQVAVAVLQVERSDPVPQQVKRSFCDHYDFS